MTVMVIAMTEHVAVCTRCDIRETFPTLTDIRQSEWRDVTPYGTRVGQHKKEHPATCPRHWGDSDSDDGGDSEDDDDVHEAYGRHMGGCRTVVGNNTIIE